MSLASVVDEIIQLWTHMWVVDAEHDNIIAENVQGLQKRCGDLVQQLIRELQATLAGPSPSLNKGGRRKLGAAPPTEEDNSTRCNVKNTFRQALIKRIYIECVNTEFERWFQERTRGFEAPDGRDGCQI